MNDQIQSIFLFTCLTVGLLLLWAACIAAVYWDATRRKLASGEVIAWVVLATLLPLVGAAAYVFSRLMATLFSPGRPGSIPARKNATLLKRAPQPEANTGTILAADLPQNTNTAVQQTRFRSPDELPAAIVKLIVIDGPHIGQEYPIFKLPAQIGRIPEAAVRLDQDLGVSRQHAEIYEQEGELRIRDLSSAHGTRLGGSNIKDQRLEPGDHIQVGITTLVVHSSEDRI